MNRYLTIPEGIRWAKNRRPEDAQAPGCQRSRIASGNEEHSIGSDHERIVVKQQSGGRGHCR